MNFLSKINTKKFGSTIETTYGLLFFGSIVYISFSIFKSSEWNSNPNTIIVLLMLFMLLAQMLRLYHVLHELDKSSNDMNHFINFIRGGWVIYERLLRLFLALIVILAVKYQNLDVITNIVDKWTFRISNAIQSQSQHFLEPLGKMNINTYSETSFLLTYYSLLMLIIYSVFWVWDLYVYLSAKAVLAKPSLEPSDRNQARSLVLYLNSKKLSERAFQESQQAYEARLSEIVNKNAFSYFPSDKCYERLVGIGFFLSTLLFINLNGNAIFLLICGALTLAFIRYNKELGGSIVRLPLELVLSMFKINKREN